MCIRDRFTHQDVPGIIGKIGTVFGTHNVNIAQMAVGRDSDSAGGKAIGVLNLDGKVPAPALEALLAVDGIHAAKMIELPPRGKLPHWLA